MKTNQFVFNFKTTAETQTSMQLEDFYSQIHGTLLDAISLLGEKAHYMIEQHLSNINGNEKLEHDISEIGNEHRQKLIEFIENPNKSYSEIMIQWKEEKLRRFDSDFADAKRDCLHQLEKARVKYRTTKQIVDNLDVYDISELKEIVKEEMKLKNASETESMIATRIWKRFSSDKFKPSPEADMDTSFIKRDVEAILLEIFSSEKHKLEKAIVKSRTSGKLPPKFEVTNTHISKYYRFFNVLRIASSRNEVETVVGIINEKAQTEIEHIGASKQAYTKTAIRRILMQVKTVLEGHIKKIITKDFEIDICVYLSNFLVNEFSRLYEQEKAEEACSLACQKTNILALIKSMMMEQNNEVQNSELQSLCADQVTNIARETAVRKTLANLHTRCSFLQSLRNKSKQQCIDYILSMSIRSKAFVIVDLYMTDPEEALVQMLIRCIGTGQLQKDALSDFERRLRVFQTNMKKFHVSRNTMVGEFISLTLETSNLDILESYYIKSIQAVDIDILKLQENVTERIKSVKECIQLNEMLKQIETHNEAIKRKAAESFLTRKLGCLEKCPFCDEMCMYDTINHVGQHQAATHRPVGSKKICHTDSKRIYLDTCSTLARSETVIFDGVNNIPLNDFSKFYPDWKIRPHYYNKVAVLWKWYFAERVKSKLSSKYKVIVPTAWTLITEEEVVRTLMLSSTN